MLLLIMWFAYALGWKPSVASTTENFLQLFGRGLKLAQLRATAHREST
jgi:hypothetical protein